MGFERWRISSQFIPAAWLIAAFVAAFCAGCCFARGSLWWLLFLLLLIYAVAMMIRGIVAVEKRIKYIVEATLNDDFSFKFPVDNVDGNERVINTTLNSIVEHFEYLTAESRRQEAFLKRVIDLTEVGVAVADAQGNIQLHNEVALRLLERQALTHICQLPKQTNNDLVIRKSALTVKDKSFTVFTFSDLSRQMQMVEVESWEKLTRMLTHEIMNSLTPIQSMAETMSGRPVERDMAEAFETIASSSRSLMQFVKRFREFTKLPELRMRALYLKPLLESCVKLSREYIGDKNITITLSCFPPDVMTYTDETLLNHVVLNILKNAIEANPSLVEVEASLRADEAVEIRISNDGEPISDETAEHLFTPFFTTRPSGSGIGLSLSRRLITHLGGTLTFKTQPVTSFIIRI